MSDLSQNQQISGLAQTIAEAEHPDASWTWARAYGGPWRRLSFSSGPPSPTRVARLLAATGGVADGTQITALAGPPVPGAEALAAVGKSQTTPHTGTSPPRALIPVGSLGLLVGYDEAIARWVTSRLGLPDFEPCIAIGITRGADLIAGVVYAAYCQANIEMTIASASPAWCTRAVLKSLFWYPFEQLGCHRVTAITEGKNRPVREFLLRLGFQEEGVMRRSYLSGADAVIYGMLREECRWLSADRRSWIDRGKSVKGRDASPTAG
jgi:hypothetical protein